MKFYGCYWVLGLNFDCQDREITNAFNYSMLLARKYNNSVNQNIINTDFILDIYNILINKDTRKEYDDYIKIKALQVCELMSTLESILNNSIKREHQNISVSLLIKVKKTMTYINNVLSNQKDVAKYIEQFYFDTLSQYRVLQNSYKKQLF